ncbi:MAG TPA: hypothetical protein VHP55_08035 [Usitatibacter sp.]|jgi:hypothetical protein|nr:hypothetical protein [Usitatibacter sp.]
MPQRLIWVLWPGFLMAIPAVGVVFTIVDPADVHGLGIEGRTAAYTVGFLFFWAIGAACSALTCLLQRSPFEVNRCPLPREGRPEGCPKRSGGAC